MPKPRPEEVKGYAHGHQPVSNGPFGAAILDADTADNPTRYHHPPKATEDH